MAKPELCKRCKTKMQWFDTKRAAHADRVKFTCPNCGETKITNKNQANRVEVKEDGDR